MEQHSRDHERENQYYIFFLGYFTSLAQKLVRMRPAQNARLHRMVFLSTPHLLQRLNNSIIESFAELEEFDN